MKKISDPVGYAKSAVESYKSLYGEELESVILFGSAAGGDFNQAESDINLLIILTSMNPDRIARSAPLQKQLTGKRFARPLFMDKAYIASSLDSYPMEFLDMKGCYRVLHGEDVLSELTPENEHLRLQVERELKGKWLHLLQEYPEVMNNAKKTSSLIRISLKAFMPVFRAFLFLKGVEIPADRATLIKAVDTACDFSDAPLQNAAALAMGDAKNEAGTVFTAYMDAIKAIIDIIDNQ